MHFATEIFAGPAMGKFMRCNHEKNDEHNHRNGRILEDAGKSLDRVLPIGEGYINGAEYDNRRDRQKQRCIEETNFADQIIEKPVRIEEPDPQIQGTSLNP